MAITKVSRNLLSTGIDDQSNATAITIDSSENVIIGSSSALGLLTIKAPSSDDQDLITISEDGTNQAFSINSNFAGAGSTGNNITLDSYWTNDIISFRGDGNVGIGTASPLTQNNGVTLTLGDGSTQHQPYLKFNRNSTGGYWAGIKWNHSGTESAAIEENADKHLIFATNGAERIRINSAGQLLVGSTSNVSGTRVYIDGGSSNLGQLGLRNSSATSGNYWRIGQNTDSHYTHYNQSGTGVYLLNGGTSWSGNSDETLKENIVELSGVLDKVKDFRCVEYNLISDATKSKKIGFIAQDWQEDYSQVVSQDGNEKLGMAYTETIPVLLKAIQEQQALIEAQATTITDLTTRIETLES